MSLKLYTFTGAFLLLTLLLLSLCIFHLQAQPSKTNTGSMKTDSCRMAVNPKDRHLIFSFNMGALFIQKTRGLLSIAFPYASKDVSSAAITQGKFAGSLQDPFHTNAFLMDVLAFEVTSKRHSIETRFGIIPNYMENNNDANREIYFEGGYAHIFPVYLGRSRKTPSIQIKAGLDLFFMEFLKELGTIDNRDKDLYLVGDTASSTYTTYTLTASHHSVAHIHQADHLYVGFAHNSLDLVPGIRITTNPAGHHFCWAILASWFVPLVERGGLFLKQMPEKDGDPGNDVQHGFVSLSNKNITASLDNTPITKSPYSFGRLYIGASVGVAFPGIQKHSKRRKKNS